MANMLVFVMTIAVLVGANQVSALTAGPCGCYTLNMYTMATCSPTSVFTVTTPKLTLNGDCSLVSEGCVNYGPFTSANVTAVVTNAATTYTSTTNIDGCKAMTFIPTEYKALMTFFTWDTACPVLAAKTVCANPPVTNMNIAAMPYFLEALDYASRLGVVNATLTATHGLTSSSCLKFAAEIKKDPACLPVTMPVVGFPNLPPIPGVSTIAPPTVPTVPTLTTLPSCVRK